MKPSTNNIGKTRVVTGECRASYESLLQPKQSLNGNMEYSCSILIPKTDKKTVADIEAAIDAAKAKAKNEKWGGKIPPNCKSPMRDGDTDRPNDDAYKGHWFINAKSRNKPNVVDQDVRPIIDRTQVYSGGYFRFALSLYGYNVNGNIGVAAGLENAQKLRDGDPLGGSTSAESDFEPIKDGLEDALA
jgi:hypothetical protein